MYSTVEIITPELAKQYLAMNIENNRKVSMKVNEYARDMAAGRWQLTSQGITFNQSGKLTDGQHRLLAIIKSGVPVKMYVTRGEDDSVTIHDRGRARTTADIAVMSKGFSHCMSVGETRSTIGAANIFFMCAGVTRPSDSMILEFVENHAELFSKAVYISKIGNRSHIMHNSNGFGAVYAALSCGVSEDVLKNFAKVVNTGFQDSQDQKAAILARNFMMQKRGSSTADRKRALSIMCSAIQDFVAKNPRTRIYPERAPEKVPYLCEIVRMIKWGEMK